MAGLSIAPVVRRAALAGLLVAVASYASILLTRGDGHVPALWAADAILLVSLFRVPPPHWPAMIAAGFAGNGVAHLALGDGWLLAAGLAGASTVAVLMSAAATRHFIKDGYLRLYRVTDWLWCVGTCIILAPGVSASLAAFLLYEAAGEPFLAQWILWFAADALGIVLLVPLLINLHSGDLGRLLTGQQLGRAVIILLTVAVLSVLAFLQDDLPILFLIPPSLIFAVFVLGIGAASLAAVLAGAIALAFTVAGSGPIALLEPDLTDRVLLVQVFIAIAAFTCQPIAVTLAHRNKLLEEMLEARKSAERANSYLQLAENIAQVGHWFLLETPDGTVENRWSEGLLRIFGLPAGSEGPSGDALIALVHPDDRPGHNARVREALDARRQYEFRVQRPDGTVRQVAMRGIAEDGPPPYRRSSVGVILDVTEMKRAATSLAESESRYRVLADNATDMIMLLDRSMQPIYVSPAGQAITGYDCATLLTMKGHDFVHPDDLDSFWVGVGGLRSGGPRAELVFRSRHRDGSWRWLESRIARVSGEGPSGAAFVVTVRDVTQRQQERAVLEIAMRKAEEASRVKSTFLANMSHEIRTPMNSVIGFTELLLDSKLSEEQAGHANMVLEAGKSLLTLLNDILDISKIEAGKLELETIPYSPRSVVEEAVALVRRQASDKKLLLSTDIADEVPPWALGDPTRLRQILINLLSNALKFTLQGSVTVRLRRIADRLHFAVIDTGIGIASESQVLLFQDFSQADRSTTRRFGGTGLGLALCKRLTEGMGGEIGATSQPGIGSEFWFALPLVEPAVVPDPAGHPVAGAETEVRRARILVAEDLQPNQILVAEMLKGAGHDVQVVGNGTEAVEAVRHRHFDLVLMDVAMPEMDGIDATRAIRQLSGQHVPIIALSASAMPEQEARCRAAGMDDFVAKPCSRGALLDVVGRWAARVA